MHKLLLALLFTAFAFADDVERVFRLANTPTTTGRQEIATTLRTVAQIGPAISLDNAAGTIVIHGSASQIAFAEWLVPRLDVATATAIGPQNYNVAGNSNDIAVVYPLTHTDSLRGLQELITTIRSVADLQRIYMVSGTKILAYRSIPTEVSMANFLVSQLDGPAKPGVRRFQIPKDIRGFDTLAVFSLAHAGDDSQVQSAITTVRLILNIMRMFGMTANRTLAMRSTAQDIESATWLLSKLDREIPDTSDPELHMPGGRDDVVRVFYLPDNSQPATLATSIRNTTKIQQISVNTKPLALVVRGTANQIAMAQKLIATAGSAIAQSEESKSNCGTALFGAGQRLVCMGDAGARPARQELK